MNQECENLRDYFLQKLNVFRLNQTEENRKNMVEARNIYNSKARSCRIDQSRQHMNKLLTARAKDAKEFWKMLRPKCKNAQSTLSAHDFVDHFKELANLSVNNQDDVIDNEAHTLDNNYIPDNVVDDMNDVITVDEAKFAISNSKLGKSAGPDQLINELYVNGGETLVIHITTLFNIIFSTGKFPESWRKGLISPIHKKKDINDVNNYRGVTFLGTLGKLFIALLNNRLQFWAESHSVYVDAQRGFRKGRSTTDSIFILHSIINSLKSLNKKLYCAFLDLCGSQLSMVETCKYWIEWKHVQYYT